MVMLLVLLLFVGPRPPHKLPVVQCIEIVAPGPNGLGWKQFCR